jgi:hypothetical protein
MKSDGLTPYAVLPWSLRPPPQPCTNEEQMCACCISTMAFSAYTAKFSLLQSHCHQSQTSYYGLHSLGLQVSGNLRVLDCSCWVNVVTLSHQILWWLHMLSNLCKTLHCHAEARCMLPEFCWYRIPKNHSFTVQEDCDNNLVCWWRFFEFSLTGRMRMVPSMDCLFVSRSTWWNQLSYAVTGWDKVSPPASKCANNLKKLAFPLVFCSTVRLW